MEQKNIAIIPAKAHSQRIPNKNLVKIGNKYLFEYSVEYAIQEGLTPIVSTDSELIVEWCERNSVKYVVEEVDDSNMCNCINQVLSNLEYTPAYFTLLQPTSPIRKEGLCRELLEQQPQTSIYTCDKIKIIGHIGNKFHKAYRDQDSNTNFLYHFDGNTVIVNTEWYKKERVLFNDQTKYYEQTLPYILQIDNKEELDLIRRLLENSL